MISGPKALADISFGAPSLRDKQKRGAGLRALLFAALLGASQFAFAPAYADEGQLQRQIDAMKRQLEKMERELAQTKRQPGPARAVSAPAGAAPVVARNGNEIILPAPVPPPPGWPAAAGQGASDLDRWRSLLDGRIVHRDGRCGAAT